jgi:predicted nuclease with TOPRIM domain
MTSSANRDFSLWPGRSPWRMLALMTTEEHITQLEHQLHELQGQQAELRRQLAKAQLDQWQGRIEDLEVQMHLGAVETSEKANAQMNKLRDRWADAKRQLEESIKTASSVKDTVRAGLENAFGDLRRALLESRNKLTSPPGR